MWVKPDAASLIFSPVFIRGNLRMEIKDSFIRVLIGDEILNFDSLGKLTADEWTFLNLSIDEFSSKVEVIIGTDERKGCTQGYSTKIKEADGTIFIGGAPDEPKMFNGFMDEIQVYHRLLTRKDLECPIIYNISLKGAFTPLSSKVISLKIMAENAEFMRIYQAEKMGDSRWENFRNQKLLEVSAPAKGENFVKVIAEFKNGISDKVKQVTVSIPITEESSTQFILPPPGAELTSR